MRTPCWRDRAVAAILATLVSAGAAAAQTAPTDAHAEGRVVAERLCARCHAIDAVGASPFAPAPPFREIARRYSVWHLEEALAEGIVVNHEAMPEFELPPREIGALLGYMETLGE